MNREEQYRQRIQELLTSAKGMSEKELVRELEAESHRLGRVGYKFTRSYGPDCEDWGQARHEILRRELLLRVGCPVIPYAKVDEFGIEEFFEALVMMAVSGTLVLRESSFIYGLTELLEKADPPVPERFQPVIEELHIHQGRVRMESKPLSDIFYGGPRIGGVTADRIHPNSFRMYVLEGVRGEFLVQVGLSEAERNWLWELAQVVHELPDDPPRRFPL